VCWLIRTESPIACDKSAGATNATIRLLERESRSTIKGRLNGLLERCHTLTQSQYAVNSQGRSFQLSYSIAIDTLRGCTTFSQVHQTRLR